MSSGGHSLAVSPDVVPTFSLMKVRRKHKWMLLTAHPETLEIGIAATGPPTDGIDDFLAALPSSACAYAVYDSGKAIYFILWAPESAAPSSKMLFASHQTSIGKQLPGTMDLRSSSHHEIRVKLGLEEDEVEEEWDPDA